MNRYLSFTCGAVEAHKTKKKVWEEQQIRGFFKRNSTFILSHGCSRALSHTFSLSFSVPEANREVF